MIVAHGAEYKDSGVPWIGTLPSDWEVMPAKALFSNPSEPSLSTDVHLTPSQKYGVLPQVQYMEISGSSVVLNLSGAENMRHVEAGDFVSHLRSFQGGLEYSTFTGKVSNAYTVLRPRQKFNHRFFQYLFKSNMYVQGLQTTTDQLRDGQSIRYGQFALLPLPLPPQEVQDAIVRFLDRETQQIDELISKQQQLVHALKEKIQAQINHAVTGGLQHDVKGWRQTESWAGSIPDHWGLSKLKYLADIQQGYSFSADLFEAEGHLPVVKQSDFFLDQFTTYTSEVVPKRFLIENGDVLISMSGDFNCKLWGRGIAGLNQRCASIRADINQVSNLWLSYVLPAALEDLSTRNVSTTVSNMSSSELANLFIPSPPISEQIEVSAYLDREVSKTETLSSNALDMVQLLNERRQALICAAVTGMIDVRGN